MSTERIDIQIREDGSRVVRRNLDDLGNSAATAHRSIGLLGEGLKGFVGSLVGGLAIGALASDILRTNREMESLRTQLVGVTGSIAAGKEAFSFVQKFAADTPFEIDGLTKSFILLKSTGIEPTKQVMEALTNQAAKLGGSQETLMAIVTQLGQAYSKQKLQQEDIIVLAERGVPIYKLLAEVTGLQGAALQEVIGKGGITRDVIDKLIVKMGELATGSNARAMETLNGKISVLSDSWHTFEDTLLNDKSEGIIKNIVSSAAAALGTLTKAIDSSVDGQINKAKERIKSLESLNQSVGFNVAKNSIEAEQRKLKNLELNKRFLQEADGPVIAKPTGSKPTTQIEIPETKKKKSTGKSDFEIGQDYIKQLEREVALLNDSTKLAQVKYDIQSGALAKISPKQKEMVLSLAQEIEANDKQKKQWEAAIEEANKYYDIRKEISDLSKTELTSDTFGSGLSKIQDAFNSGIITEAQAKEQFDILGKAFNDSYIDPALSGMEKLGVFAEQAAKNMQDAFADFLFDPFKGGLDGMLTGFLNVIKRMVAEQAAAQLFGSKKEGGAGGGDLIKSGVSAVSGIIGGLFGGGAGGFNGTGPLLSFAGKKFASGGSFDGGFRLVGENGPELEATGPSKIFNASQTKDILKGAAGGGVNVTVNFNGAPPADKKAASQLAYQIGTEAQRAVNRNG